MKPHLPTVAWVLVIVVALFLVYHLMLGRK